MSKKKTFFNILNLNLCFNFDNIYLIYSIKKKNKQN